MLRRQVNCKECDVKCPIKLCSPEHIELADERKSQVLYQRQQHVFREGAPVDGMYFIQSGKVKVISSNMDGREQIVRLAGTGHILGHRGFGGEVYPVGAITLADSRICFLDNEFLLAAFKANFEFLHELMQFYSEELRKSEVRTQYFAQMTVAQKVIYSLVYLYETFSAQPDAERLALSRNEIASIAGTNAEQVSRTLARLKKQRCIATEGHDIIITDMDALRNELTGYLTVKELP